jgi:phosphomannomutase
MSSALMVGVSGLRGVIGSSLTPEVASRFAASFGSWLVPRAGGRPVLICLGRDGRAGHAFVHHAALSGLLASGCSVLDLGVVTTPTTAVMTDHTAGRRPGEVVAGMVITASHNPQNWNGLKCLLGNGQGLCGSSACAPPAAQAQQIVDLFRSGTPALAGWDRQGTIELDESANAVHLTRVLDALAAAGITDDPQGVGEGLSVVLDSVNASGVEAGSALLDQLGVQETLHLGCEATGIFPHTPEPVRENLSAMAQAVRESEAAVGFAQDPDADRLAIIDETGSYIGEEYTLVLCVLAILEAMKRRGEKTQGAVLAVNLSTSRMIEDVAARFGARVLRTAVGEANVVDAMKAHSAVAGGEGNGGIIWPRTTYVRDSLAGMALVLSLLGQGRRTLSEIVRTIPAYAIDKRKVDLARKEDARPAVEKLAKAYAAERVDLQDGVRVDFDARRAWLHVRASNTEPIMRLIAEAPTAGEASAVLADAERIIRG